MTNGFRLAFQIGQIARRVGALMRVRASSYVPSEVDGVRARPDDDVLARTCRGHRRDRYKRGDEHRTHRARRRALANERMTTVFLRI